MMVPQEQQHKPAFPDYPVNVEDIMSKVLWADVAQCQDGITKQGFPSNAWLFVRYPHFATYVDPQADVDSGASGDEEDDFIAV